jgi:hypothetical protein
MKKNTSASWREGMGNKLEAFKSRLTRYHVPAKLIFIFLGVASTLWFILRVLPKPARAGYPCMQAAAPLMSSFVIYLLGMGGTVLAFRKSKQNMFRARYVAAFSLLVGALIGGTIFFTHDARPGFASTNAETGPIDGPNQPMGVGQGILPGRVVWAWDADATRAECTNAWGDYFFKNTNTNQTVVAEMFQNSIKKLTGKETVVDAWDALFKYHNLKKHSVERAYQNEETIFIKINQGTASWNTNNDFGLIQPTGGNSWRENVNGACETGPYIVLEILNHLVNTLGIDESYIAVGDPMAGVFKHNFDVWHTAFPDVHYIQRFDLGKTQTNRTLLDTTLSNVIFYSDKGTKMPKAINRYKKTYDMVAEADYMINVANLKPHGHAGITLTAKNHFGTQANEGAGDLHPALLATSTKGVLNNGGYGKYRVQVDIMGSKYLGMNTMLYVVDGLFGGGADETRTPVKYFMAPFDNDWANSIFISLDQVALESVCFDFLRTEWDGVNVHSSKNNAWEAAPNMNGVDDYLHQASDPTKWAAGITYDPDNSGTPLGSLGVHEHWNNATLKQYSRNLGFNFGIELVSIPEGLVTTITETKRISTRGDHNRLSNYPNPAREYTTFVVNLPSSGDVTLEIYSIQGQKVYSIEAGMMNQGEAEIRWNINSNIKSGVYLAKIIHKSGLFETLYSKQVQVSR